MSTKKKPAPKPAEVEEDAPPVEIDQDPSDVNFTPPCPPENPRDGDKTPEVVAWWFAYRPEEAAAKYGHRRFARPD